MEVWNWTLKYMTQNDFYMNHAESLIILMV